MHMLADSPWCAWQHVAAPPPADPPSLSNFEPSASQRAEATTAAAAAPTSTGSALRLLSYAGRTTASQLGNGSHIRPTCCCPPTPPPSRARRYSHSARQLSAGPNLPETIEESLVVEISPTICSGPPPPPPPPPCASGSTPRPAQSGSSEAVAGSTQHGTHCLHSERVLEEHWLLDGLRSAVHSTVHLVFEQVRSAEAAHDHTGHPQGSREGGKEVEKAARQQRNQRLLTHPGNLG